MGRRIGKCCRLVVAGGGETNQNMAKMGGGGGGRTVIRLPPGFRFQPTDEELVMHYLRRKVLSCPLPASIIPDIQLSRFDPWDLPGGGAAASSGDDRYLFNLRMGKCRNSNRANRAAGSGFWKATGKDKLITSSRGGHVIGIKKFLVFYRGKPLHGRRTDWVMHEYYYLTAADPSAANYMGDWVLCHTFQKKRPFARRNTEDLDDDDGDGGGGGGHEDVDNTPPSPPMSCVTDISDGEYNSEDEEEGCCHSTAGEEKY